MTQRDLAEKLNRPRSFVGKIESIERNLSVLELVQWIEAVGLEREKIPELLGQNGDTNT